MKFFHPVIFGSCLLLLLSCVQKHYDRSENFTFSWKIGDFEAASREAEALAEKGPSRDRMLYRLEEGSIKRMNGDFPGSVSAFSKAGDYYDAWFGTHLKSQTKISEELLSTIGSQEWKPYKSRVYERVMLRLYQALNFLQMNEEGRARAEVFKIRQSIQDAKEIWRKELDASRHAIKRKSIDFEKVILNQDYHPLKTEIARVRKMIPPNFPEYVNPAALYLESLYFLHGSGHKDDFEKAAFSLRELLAIFPDNQWISEDLTLAMKKKKSKVPVTYVFFETGRAPVRREKRFDLPLVFLSPTSRLPYLGLAFPILVSNDNFLSRLQVASNGNGAVNTIGLGDMDAIVSKEYDKDFPVELSKSILSSLSKGGLQYFATNAVRSENEISQVATGVIAGGLSQALTGADWRSWTTLPKQIQFCKVPSPESRELTFKGLGTKLETSLTLKPGIVNCVWIRSVSGYTPLRVVNNFAFIP